MYFEVYLSFYNIKSLVHIQIKHTFVWGQYLTKLLWEVVFFYNFSNSSQSSTISLKP